MKCSHAATITALSYNQPDYKMYTAHGRIQDFLQGGVELQARIQKFC
jgi:hypothetical protein